VSAAEISRAVEPRNETKLKTSRERPFSTVVNTKAKQGGGGIQIKIVGLQLCRDVSGRGSAMEDIPRQPPASSVLSVGRLA
jgi:hypothetical protein